jgi:hypothetical protein
MIVQGSKAGVKDGFYVGTIKSVAEKPGDRGPRIETEFSSNDLPFPIKRMIFLNRDMSDSFKVDLFMKAAGVQPRSVTRDFSGTELKEYELQDAVGRPIMAYVYQGEYANVWDYLSVDATDSEKNVLMTRYNKYFSKPSQAKDSGTVPF